MKKEKLTKEIIFKTRVIPGVQRGRVLGFPTANLIKKNLDISYGVYLVEVKINQKKHQGLLHFGYKKTFSEGLSIEIFIKDFSANLYNKEIEVRVIKKIREIKKFSSPEKLKNQIKKDIKITT